MCMCMSVMCVQGAIRQKVVSDSLELTLQEIVSHPG